MLNPANRYFFLLAFFVSFLPKVAWSQISSDDTLSTNVTTPDGLNFLINDGNRVQSNLFHSFREFSVPIKGSATFNNPLDIENIIARITGGSVSEIDGLIRANGEANLFLINPQGIVFGLDARLEIGGSFLSSTASNIKFADGKEFSATNPEITPLLTINTPIGLQFGSNPGQIINQSTFAQTGLQVQPGKTLALVGSNLALEGGRLRASQGRIELGSVAANSLVNLEPTPDGYTFNYDEVEQFQDIQLSNQAIVDTSGNGGGNIQVRGQDVTLSDVSIIAADNLGAGDKGSLTVAASESVQLSSSGLFARTAGSGDAGDLTVNTQRLLLQDGAQISTITVGDGGKGGNLTVNASQSIQLIGFSSDQFLRMRTFLPFDNRIPSGLFANTLGRGDGGKLTINTQQLNIEGKANVNVTTFGAGRGGNLEINTERLIVQDGSQIAAGTAQPEGGNGGSLTVNATESILLSGKFVDANTNRVSPSGLFAQTLGTGRGGDMTIRSGKLIVQDDAQITVASFGSGIAGNLNITANSVELDQGIVTARTMSSENGGNVELNIDELLLLRNQSQISTNAGQPNIGGNGGNIEINTNFIVAVPTENSDITANAFKGRGGNINITAKGIFGIEVREAITPLSDITADSGSGIDGVVEINTPEVDPSQDVGELPSEIFDPTQLIANSCLASNLGQGGSFIIIGAGGLSTIPDDLAVSPFHTYEIPGESSNDTPERQSLIIGRADANSRQPGDPIIEAGGIYRLGDGRVVLGKRCL